MNSNNTSLFFITAIFFASLVLLFNISILSALNYFLFTIIFYRFINRLGKEIPIKELTSFVLLLQMIITPLVAYQVYDNNIGYSMDVSEDKYISLITPLVFSFILGLYIPLSKRKVNLLVLFSQTNQANLVKYGWYFVIIGLFSDFTISLFPESLRFIVTIFSYFQFLGVFCLFFSTYKHKNLVVSFVYGLYFLNAIRTGMFYGAIVWGFFLMALFFIKYKASFITKSFVIFACFASLIILQAVKREYRDAIRGNRSVNKVEQFYTTIDDKLESETITKEEGGIGRFIERVNTGHITAKVFKHTPSKQPFSYGKDLSEDLVAILLPRFLFPNKKSVGGSDNNEKFFKYTGRVLNDSTIMRIGVIGDAYINFGPVGGSILLFIFGLLLNLLLVWINKYSFSYPVLILWIPIIFTYIVRMSDFIVLVNSVVKILFVLMLLLVLVPHIFLHKKKNV